MAKPFTKPSLSIRDQVSLLEGRGLIIRDRAFCAHHGRLWNRRLTVTPVLPSTPADLAASVHPATARQIYNSLAMIQHMMTIIAPHSDWGRRLFEFVANYPANDQAAMGFPADWAGRPLWQAVRIV
jgi:abortive infection bacteriophage resistance protein